MPQWVFQAISIATPLFIFILGWFMSNGRTRLKDMDERLNDVDKGLAEHRLSSSRDYATKVDMFREYGAIQTQLQRIEDKLDRKVDR